MEIRSTLWPVAKLIRDVLDTKDKEARLAHVKKFARAVCGRWLVGFNHDGNLYDWSWMGKRFGADPDALCELIDCGELLKRETLADLATWLAGLASKYDRVTHTDSLTILEEIRDRLQPHILPESKKWRNADSLDGTCPFVVPTKKWGSQNCSGYNTWDDFCDDEAGEYGFVNFYIAGWLNNPRDDRGLAVSSGYREFLERHIDFEAVFPTVSGDERSLPVDRIAEKASAMRAEDADLFNRTPRQKTPLKLGAKKRGRPKDTDEKADAKLYKQWKRMEDAGSVRTIAEFAKEIGKPEKESKIRAAFDRVRKRP